MSYKVKERRDEQLIKDKCHHYWIIESANGPTSRGICKLCGTVKEFLNSVPDSTVTKQVNPLEHPKLKDVHFDESQKS